MEKRRDPERSSERPHEQSGVDSERGSESGTAPLAEAVTENERHVGTRHDDDDQGDTGEGEQLSHARQ